MATQLSLLKARQNFSNAELLAFASEAEQTKFYKGFNDQIAYELMHSWEFWGRPDQFAPKEDWRVWLILAGRGWGKTRTGAETIRQWKDVYGRMHLVAPTAGDVRDVMVEGESGIMAISPDWDRPLYEPSKRRLTWNNGAQASLYSADEPERLRGPQCEAAWCDEIGSWRYPDAWDMLMLGLRLGPDPRCIVTTTPKPITILKELVARVGKDVVITKGSTYDNKSNLADAFFEQIVSRYEGTRLGQQEIYAELLESSEFALWNRDMFVYDPDVPDLRRIVVAIDPAATSGESSDETGIMVSGVDRNGHGWVLEDLSGRYSPEGWAKIAVGAYRKWGADRIIGEVNNGGEMIKSVLNTVDAHLPYKAVTASRGKAARAEPIVALYEQKTITHSKPFTILEDQLCTWEPLGKHRSPDRLDALVWSLTELMLIRTGPRIS